MTKKRVFLFVMVCLFFLLTATFVQAGGGINWKLEFRNVVVHGVTTLQYTGKTGIFDCDVRVFYGIAGQHYKEARIASGETYVFEFGAECPIGIGGTCTGLDWGSDARTGYGIYYRRDFGIERTHVGIGDIALPACYNTTFRLCKGYLPGTLAVCAD